MTMQHFLTRSPDNRGQNMTALEVRDAATSAWHDFSEQFEEGDVTTSAERSAASRVHFAARALRDLGLDAKTLAVPSSSTPIISVTANDDTVLVLEFDPMQDGFDYADSADDADELDDDDDEPTSFIASLEARAARLGGDDGALILEAVGRLGAEDA
jgi:hypothetical protein